MPFLFQVLASYINPVSGTVNGDTPPPQESGGQNSNAIPSVLLELLSQSCLIPAMSSYLRNDSGQSCCPRYPAAQVPPQELCGVTNDRNKVLNMSLWVDHVLMGHELGSWGPWHLSMLTSGRLPLQSWTWRGMCHCIVPY